MTTPRKGFRVFVTQIPDVIWGPLTEAAEAAGCPVSGFIVELLREHFHIPPSQIPPPGRPGRKPKPSPGRRQTQASRDVK